MKYRVESSIRDRSLFQVLASEPGALFYGPVFHTKQATDDFVDFLKSGEREDLTECWIRSTWVFIQVEDYRFEQEDK